MSTAAPSWQAGLTPTEVAWVQTQIADAPPLTPEQVRRIAPLVTTPSAARTAS